jgi:hypothetical protein
MLMELRQAYIGPTGQSQQPQPFASPQAQSQQQIQPQPTLQMQTPQLPQAAPLQPMRPMQSPMTASLSGLRPDFQVQGPGNLSYGQQPQMQTNSASSPQNQLLAQRLQQFMNQGGGQNAQFANALDEQQAQLAEQNEAANKAAQPSGWQTALQGLGSVAKSYVGTEAGAAGINSALGGLGGKALSGAATSSLGAAKGLALSGLGAVKGLALANPLITTGLVLGGLGYGGYKAYQHFNQPQSQPQARAA